MESVEVKEFKKIMKGELGEKEDLEKIKNVLKQIHEQHGKFKVVDTMLKEEYVIDIKDGKITWNQVKD